MPARCKPSTDGRCARRSNIRAVVAPTEFNFRCVGAGVVVSTVLPGKDNHGFSAANEACGGLDVQLSAALPGQ